jgi:hypothetical protein
LPPRLPTPPAFRAALVAAGFALLAAAPARAIEFTGVTAVREPDGGIGVVFGLDDPLEERVEQSLGRGMPATLSLHAELWRKRTGWFDRVERSVDATVRLRYDVWTHEWRLERAGLPALAVSSVDSLEDVLSRPIALTFPGTQRLAASARCFVVLSATVKPLSVEDVEEVEGWLSGEVRDQRDSGFGAFTALPRSLFDAARNFAGLGDTRARAVSAEFTRGSLAP